MTGTVTGPAIGMFLVSLAGMDLKNDAHEIGPCFGGIIVTFASWRIIYWLQVAMTGFGLILSLLFVPEIQSQGKAEASDERTVKEVEKPSHTVFAVICMFNPFHIVRLLIYPNILLAVRFPPFDSEQRGLREKDITCGLLSTFQYSILTSARSIFNPRFHLTTALVSGLFYLAPGAGFLVGSIVGGKFSDRTVAKWIVKREGLRLPQDRLNSGLATLFGVLPAAALIYGWTLDQETGGMAVPIVAAFFGGWGLMGSFNGLNTYCAGMCLRSRAAPASDEDDDVSGWE